MRKRRDRSGNCKSCGIWRAVLHRDHVIPRHRGGTDDPSNIQFLCANCHQDKTAIEMSAVHKGRAKSAEHRAKLGAWQRGIPKPQSVREKISATLTGRVIPPEARAKMSAAQMGRVVSPEICARISAALRGRSRLRTHCPHNHAYEGDNVRVTKAGKIECRTCRNQRKRLRRINLRASTGAQPP